MNSEDMESRRLFAAGLLVRAMNGPSSWRAEESLQARLARDGVPALAGVETRALTVRLRDKGTLKGCLSASGRLSEAEAVAAARAWPGLDGQDYASRVTCDRPYRWDEADVLSRPWGSEAPLPPADLRVAVYDYGVKWNILRCLRRAGMAVTVVPAATPAAAVLAMRPDGVLLSNGPADPAALGYAVAAARDLVGKVPLMGICLGHQVLGLALGGRTYRLKFGHHGGNHPVLDRATRRVEITSQNHNYALAAESLDASRVEVTHVNLNDRTVEGLRHKSEPAFAVQYHPESAPGPHDPLYHFAAFRDLIRTA